MKRELPPPTPASRREALFVTALWILSGLYTVGYAARFAYRAEPNPALLWGMPAWVAWGVLLPWTVCTAATVWFALGWMQDEALGEEGTLDTEEAGGHG